MKIKLIGLGKMGMNIAQNMLDHHIDVVGYARSQKTRDEARALGIPVADSYAELLKEQEDQIVVWLLVPNNVVDQVLNDVLPLLKVGTIIVDGGNSNFNTSVARHAELKKLGFPFIDLGTSGGTNGARNGACLMAGGEKDVIAALEPVFLKIATKDGYAHVGKPGAGHFVKMVHNGIEYGMMQAIGEGFAFLEQSDFELDYYQIANVWNNGSIIESLLIKNIRDAFSKSPELSELAGVIDDSGEGMWMIEEALKNKVALPVITASLFARYKSKDETKFGEKVVAAIRNEFGGHKVYKKDEK